MPRDVVPEEPSFPDEPEPVEFEPPAPTRDDTRNPSRPRRRVWGTDLSRRARPVLFTVLIAAWAFARGVSGEDDERPEPVPPLATSEAARDYLEKVEDVCQAHDRAIAGSGLVPVQEIIRSEAAVTSRIAAIPAPADALEIRRRLLAVRELVDDTALWSYRVMARSDDPSAAYEEIVKPVVLKRANRMYDTFSSYGLHCDVA